MGGTLRGGVGTDHGFSETADTGRVLVVLENEAHCLHSLSPTLLLLLLLFFLQPGYSRPSNSLKLMQLPVACT